MAQIILDSSNNLIQGDFDNATVNNRTKFKTTTTNATTNVYAVPNGSATSAGFTATNAADPTNASKITIATNGSTDTQIISGINGTGTYLPLSFYTNNALAGQFDTSGNFGVGSVSPQSKFQVTDGGASSTGVARIHNPSNANTGYGSSLLFSNLIADNVTYRSLAQISGLRENNAASYAGYMAFSTLDSANALNERMRIDSSGNLLVAGTSYTYGKVTSAGSINPVSSGWASNASFAAYGSYGGGILVIDTGSGTPKGYGMWAQNNGSDFYIKGNLVGSTPTGGVYLANNGTSWSSASDENVKDIIEPITNAVDKVSSLRAVIGKYKYEADGVRHPFLIAQDIQKVLPEAISTMNKGEDDECLGLSYTETIPLLVAAIKELKTELDAVKAELATLKGA